MKFIKLLLVVCGYTGVNAVTAYPVIRQAPGDSIGMTCWDIPTTGTFGQRLMLDDYHQPHIGWTFMNLEQSRRRCSWNARYVDGTYYGETQAAPSGSGFIQIDITRDTEPDSQRTVIAYYYNDGRGPYAWIDIDMGNLYGSWPHKPKKTGLYGYILPYIAVASNNNIIMATWEYTYDYNKLHLLLTTDFGDSWSKLFECPSGTPKSQFVRASHNPGSHKVAFVWEKCITDTLAGGPEHDNDVCYSLSTDDGLTWSSPVNITNYQPSDTVRAYVDLNAIFDKNDNLHIVWTGERVVDGAYKCASKIFHWDEASKKTAVVNSPSTYYTDPGNWWSKQPGSGNFVRMPADQPQLVVDTTNGWLYCLWSGNDNPDDYSKSGWVNLEIFGAYSTDNGLTWSDYVDLTNTRTPDAPAGSCISEDGMTASPYVVDDSIFITYIEDKEAGYDWQGGGLTENPVRLWVFHKSLITGIGTDKRKKSVAHSVQAQIYPNPFQNLLNIKLNLSDKTEIRAIGVYDINGNRIKTLANRLSGPKKILNWDGYDKTGEEVPAGVYFLYFETAKKSFIKKIIKLE